MKLNENEEWSMKLEFENVLEYTIARWTIS